MAKQTEKNNNEINAITKQNIMEFIDDIECKCGAELMYVQLPSLSAVNYLNYSTCQAIIKNNDSMVFCSDFI